MKVELKKPDVNHYTNADHIESNKMLNNIFIKYAGLINAPDLLTAYSVAVTQEETIFKWVKKSEYTEKKATADHDRDRTFNGIMGILRIDLKHFDPSIRDNAKHVLNLFENYGDLTKNGYDAETAGIESLIARLISPEYLPAVQNLSLSPWIMELQNQNELFKEYARDAMQEAVEKPKISPTAARKETDEALHRIMLRITSLIDFNGPNAYAVLVEEFNVLVNHYNTLVHEHYGRLHARTDISDGTITNVGDQAWTGKPVYVIPVVSIVKKEKDGTEKVVELVFSQDYTVSYKNNVGPGTATLYIKGIGKYVGELTTTFNIQ
jgi:hypothetical protein